MIPIEIEVFLTPERRPSRIDHMMRFGVKSKGYFWAGWADLLGRFVWHFDPSRPDRSCDKSGTRKWRILRAVKAAPSSQFFTRLDLVATPVITFD
jgi:hypothetical protein